MSAETYQQLFPARDQAGRVTLRSFAVDLERAAKLAGRWAAGPEGRARLRREVADMHAHLPRWLLTVAAAGQLTPCGRCQGPLVFDGGLRCAACGRPGQRGAADLAWFGLLPPISVEGLPALAAALGERCPARHGSGVHPALGRYLLVPLVVSYPAQFPARPPRVHYLPELFDLPGMPPPRPSHACHLLGDGEQCLYAAGQWDERATAREVLQQRAFAHAIKLLNHAGGRRDVFRIVS